MRPYVSQSQFRSALSAHGERTAVSNALSLAAPVGGKRKMKAQQYIMTMVLTLLTTVTYGQTVERTDTILVDELKKTWYPVGITPDSLPVYKSTTHIPNGWGARIEFHYNGDFVDAYSAPCGNDRSIHHWKGYWTLNQDSMILKMVTYQEGREILAEIKKLTTTELILKTIKTPAANNR